MLWVVAGRYINKYFDLLITGISAHGGDVIKFAGDALQVVWRNRTGTFGSEHSATDTESIGKLVARASLCCLDLLSNLNEYSPVEGVVLRLHMGVGAGELSEFYVGGHNDKWEYFVAGEPIEQVRRHSHGCAPGCAVALPDALAATTA